MPLHSRLLAITASLALSATAAQADVVISSAPTQNMTCSAGVCAPTATDAVLNVGDLETLLAAGNVEVTTTGSSVQAGTIDISTALSWSQASVTLGAQDSIVVNAPISVGTATSELEVDIAAGSEGVLSFGRKGKIVFASLSDIFGINGIVFTLENSIQGLAAAITANPNGDYALANNYDASQDGTYSNSPINSFDGTLEGLGNTISKLSIVGKSQEHQEGDVALFAELQGAIENTRLVNIRYKLSHGKNIVGGLVANNMGGNLFGDDVQGSIVGIAVESGGLVGSNSGTIISSSADVVLNMREDSGYTGGLVGYNTGLVSLSSATGAVTGGTFSGATSGGLVALNLTTIDQSFSTGPVNGNCAGGLVGNIYGDDTYGEPTIYNSYATGEAPRGAGFVCYVETIPGSEIESSYSTGYVGANGGGFECTYYAPNQVDDDYWDMTTSGTDDGLCGGNISGVTGLTTQQLRSGMPVGFDPSIWAQDKKINDGFPYLISNPPPK